MVDDCIVSRGLENLNENELLEVIKVVAQDLQFRRELYLQIKKREAESRQYNEEHVNNDAVCCFCKKTFYFFRRATACEDCQRRVCKNCLENGLCPACTSRKALKHRWVEWSIICPYSQSQFGLCKLIASDSEGSKQIDWTMRAKVELHAIHQLDHQIDDAWVNFAVIDGTLESARQKLLLALLDHSSANSHYAYIDDAIVDIRRISSKRWSCIQTTEIRVETVGYFHLLANAIISTILNISKSANRRNSLSFRKRSLALPPLLDVEFDESATLSGNWFMKAPFSSPRGSMRSQCASRLINSITTPQLFTYGGVDEASEVEFDSVDDLLEAANTPTSGSECSGIPSGSLLKIQLERRLIKARNGELVRIMARAEIDDGHQVELVWYNGRGELKSGGRILITRRGPTSLLEMFDCVPEDSGQLVCMAIGPVSIASDVAYLDVNDEDLAGDEPLFVDPLHTSLRVRNGTTVSFKCRVSGFPEPHVSFHFNNHPITVGRRFQIDHVDNCWMLRISDCSLTDEGNYAAVATSRVGKAISRMRFSVLAFAKTSNA
ncbi:hypothetical protein L596_007958 [Steinernema carpocapsae]|uniref:Ig-like domain-containing protein n=1 Tax=Steinernema carpocapsae TaxID=34508 RepID=A0A4U5PBA8_STECR|nr:hypothetical protein L596_007958 [Steinernema carpocapsae]